MGNSLSTQDVVTDRDIILQEAREREEYRLKLLNEVIKATTYKKGEINKEVVRLPMPTSNKVIANKKINLKTYGSIMLHSKWGGTFLNEDNRYIYNDYINEKCEEIAKDCQISKRTLKNHIAKGIYTKLIRLNAINLTYKEEILWKELKKLIKI